MQQVHTAPFRSQEAVEAVGNRLARQLNRHHIRSVGIPEIKTREVDTAGTRVKRTILGDETKLAEREGLERKQSRTITSEDHPNVLRSYILDLAKAGAQGLQDEPRSAETNVSQMDDYVRTPLDITMDYHAEAKPFTASLLRDHAFAILEESDEAKDMMWTEGVRGPRASMIIHQILMEQVHVWVWHDKFDGRQPTTLSQPPAAIESQRQAELTPRAAGTDATGNEEGRILCHTDQQNQSADSSCSIGAHSFAMIVHDGCHNSKHEASSTHRRPRTRDKAIVQSPVAVVGSFTPIRYAHSNRSVPLWSNGHVAASWVYRDMIVH